MNLEDVINKRQAVRSYLDKNVPDDLIEKILNLANLSPSAGNLQARRVVIVKDLAIRKKLKATCSGLGRFTIEPPVILVICSEPKESAFRYGERGQRLYALQDGTIFASYLQLAAVSLGLACCWVGSFDEGKIKKILKMPKHFRPIVILPVGYPKESPEGKARAKDLIEEVR